MATDLDINRRPARTYWIFAYLIGFPSYFLLAAVNIINEKNLFPAAVLVYVISAGIAFACEHLSIWLDRIARRVKREVAKRYDRNKAKWAELAIRSPNYLMIGLLILLWVVAILYLLTHGLGWLADFESAIFD